MLGISRSGCGWFKRYTWKRTIFPVCTWASCHTWSCFQRFLVLEIHLLSSKRSKLHLSYLWFPISTMNTDWRQNFDLPVSRSQLLSKHDFGRIEAKEFHQTFLAKMKQLDDPDRCVASHTSDYWTLLILFPANYLIFPCFFRNNNCSLLYNPTRIIPAVPCHWIDFRFGRFR